MLAAEIRLGDEIITASNTFVARSNCVLDCGGTSVFADIKEDTYNIDPAQVAAPITERTRATISVGGIIAVNVNQKVDHLAN